MYDDSAPAAFEGPWMATQTESSAATASPGRVAATGIAASTAPSA